MRVKVRLFAICRERARAEVVEVEAPGETTSIEGLKAALAAAEPALAPLLPVVRIAVNHAFADADTVVCAGDEVALIPPVSGGSGLGPFVVSEAPISVEEVERAVRHPGAGAVVSFAGVVRDHTGPHSVVALEYEAYGPMAERVLRQLGDEVQARWPGARVSVRHRVGRLVPGEVSVVIAVATPHRADAFDACRQIIERLKQDVPIWKKEERADGSVWVGVGS